MPTQQGTAVNHAGNVVRCSAHPCVCTCCCAHAYHVYVVPSMLLQRTGQGCESGDVRAGREGHGQQPCGVGMVWEQTHSCKEEEQEEEQEGLALLHAADCLCQQRIASVCCVPGWRNRTVK